MQDEGSWLLIWVIFDAFTSAISTVLFMPVVGVLMNPLVYMLTKHLCRARHREQPQGTG
jgi:hypothetical protein